MTDDHTLVLNTDDVNKVLSLLKKEIIYSENYAVIRSALAILHSICDQAGLYRLTPIVKLPRH
jgi:vesicle coat complex subunit